MRGARGVGRQHAHEAAMPLILLQTTAVCACVRVEVQRVRVCVRACVCGSAMCACACVEVRRAGIERRSKESVIFSESISGLLLKQPSKTAAGLTASAIPSRRAAVAAAAASSALGDSMLLVQ